MWNDVVRKRVFPVLFTLLVCQFVVKAENNHTFQLQPPSGTQLPAIKKAPRFLPPVLTGIENNDLDYRPGAGKISVTSTIVVSDDNENLSSATVKFTAGYKDKEDELTISAFEGIKVKWDEKEGVLELSGDASADVYQEILRSVRYENLKKNPSARQRKITFSVKDSEEISNELSRNINIIKANTAPEIAGIETSDIAYTGKTAVTASITVSDPDHTTLQRAEIKISSGYQNGEDVLSFANANGITGAWNAGTGTLTLTGEATVENYQAALRSVQFENTKSKPAAGTRTVSFTVNDGEAASNTVSRKIVIAQAANEPPVLAGIETGDIAYTGKTAVTASITVSDPDHTNLQRAEIKISSGYQNGEDVLSFANANGITGAWNAGTGTLTLTGEATVENYQSALRSVQYENTKSTSTSGLRTVSFSVSDGEAVSNTVSRRINIAQAANMPPALAGIETSDIIYAGKTTVTSSITVSDPDHTTLQRAEIKISSGYQNAEDVLSFTNASGITGAWNAGTGTLTLTGEASVENYQSALRSVQFENTKDKPATGTRTITFTVSDGLASSNTLSRKIILIQVTNQPPVLGNIESAALSYNAGSGAIAITGEITVSDSDNDNLQEAQIEISGGYMNEEDRLTFTDAEGITGTWDAQSGILTLTGEAAKTSYQSALRNVHYENTNTTSPSQATRTITFRVSDGSGNSNAVSRNISVNRLNRAPVLSNIENNNITFELNSDPVNITSTLTVSDIDGSNLASATVSIGEGYQSGEDVLSAAGADNIQVSWNQSTGTLTLSGTASIASYQKLIRNIKYVNLNQNNPSTVSRTINFVVNDGELNSNSVQRGIEFNSPPSVSSVTIDGIAEVCRTITGKYTYHDAENDPENYSAYRWLRADSPDGIRTAIPGAVTVNYTPDESDQGKYLFFEVTPQARSGSVQGKTVVSGPSAKVPANMPTASFAGSATICEGTTANISVTLTGTPPFQLAYTDGDKEYELTTSEYINHIPVTRAGTYRAIRLSDEAGCEVTHFNTEAVISTKPSPEAKISGLNNAYSLRGVPVELHGSPAGGTFSGNGVITVNNTFNPSLAGLEGSPHPVVYTYVDSNTGCFDTDTVMVEIIDADATITGLRPQSQYCTIDIPTLLTGVNIDGSKGSFTISGNAGLTDNKNNTATLDPNKLLPGNYTVSYSYTHDGTTQTIYRDITVNRVDNVIISGPDQSFYCTGSGSIPLQSNYQLGTFSGEGVEEVNGLFYFNPRIIPAGEHEVNFRFTNSLGCVITETVPVKVLSSTKPSFEVASTCWDSSAIPFTNTTPRSDSVVSWKWLFGDPGSTENESALKNPVHTYAEPGNYTVQLITTNLNNCADTLTHILHLGKKPIPDMQWNKECTGRNEALHINNISISEDSITAYRWKITEPSGNTIRFNSKEITHNFKWNEKYLVQLNLTTEYGCKDSVVRSLIPGPSHSLRDSGYYENYEKAAITWHVESVSTNNWMWQLPTGAINSAHSGTKTITSAFNTAKSEKPLIVSSTCFDFTGIDRPYIELWVNSSITSNQEGVILQYRTENSDWVTAGNTGSGLNWYNSENITSMPGAGKYGWTGTSNGWMKAAHALDAVADKKNVKFRMIYKPAPGSNSSNIFAFDDVIIGNRNRTSLFENFTNFSASNAMQRVEQLNEVLAQSRKDVVSLQYHTSFPGSDSLNTNNSADPGARVLHYGVGVVPYALLNGGNSPALTFDFISRTPTHQDVIAQSLSSSPFQLQIATEKADGSISGKVIVTSGGNYTNLQTTLQMVIVEDITVQSNTTRVTLYNVVKKFLPSAGGTSLKNTWTAGEQVEIPFNWDFVKVYNPDKVKIVAFIQSNATREVLQATSNEITFVTSNPLVPGEPAEVPEVVVAPNPAGNYSRILFPDALELPVLFELIGMNGKLIKKETIEKGVSVFEFSTEDLGSGLYFIRLQEKSGKITIRKLSVVK